MEKEIISPPVEHFCLWLTMVVYFFASIGIIIWAIRVAHTTQGRKRVAIMSFFVLILLLILFFGVEIDPAPKVIYVKKVVFV